MVDRGTTTFAEKIINATMALSDLESQLYEKLEEIFGNLTSVEFKCVDYYDNSIEITAPEGFPFTQEHAIKLCNLGFLQGWINYPNNTDQFFNAACIGPIKSR
jgi:hypothetical protein